MLDPAPFLKVALFTLSAPFTFKMQPGIPKRGIYFSTYLTTIDFFALAHYLPLFRTHLNPALGVSLKDLSVLWRHRLPALARITKRWRAVRRRQSSAGHTLLTPRLSICRQWPTQNENRDRRRDW